MNSLRYHPFRPQVLGAMTGDFVSTRQPTPLSQARATALQERCLGLEGEAFAYLLLCADGSLYAGWTNDLGRRLAAHQSGKASRYSRARLPVTLVYAEALPTRSEAMRREAALKRMPTTKKWGLVELGAQGQ